MTPAQFEELSERLEVIEAALQRIAGTPRVDPHENPLAWATSLAADYYGVPRVNLHGNGRSRDRSWPRQMAMYLLHKSGPNRGCVWIANQLNLNHTTIIYGIRAHEARMLEDSALRRYCNRAVAGLGVDLQGDEHAPET